MQQNEETTKNDNSFMIKIKKADKKIRPLTTLITLLTFCITIVILCIVLYLYNDHQSDKINNNVIEETTKISESETETEPVTEKITETIKETEVETVMFDPITSTINEQGSKRTDTGNAELNSICDKIFDSTLTDNMTRYEALHTLYKWVQENIAYVMSENDASWQQTAINTFNAYSGDCEGFYAALRALFTRYGIKCERADSETKDHVWVIAEIDGTWYHFDATPGWGDDRFMLTTQELIDYVYYGNDKYPDGLRYIFTENDMPV